MPDNQNLKIQNKIELARNKEKNVETKKEIAEKEISALEKENYPEIGFSKKEKTSAEDKVVSAKKEIIGGAVIGGAGQRQKKEREKQIEKILEKDLGDIYVDMPLDKQKEFKIAGEQTAREINILLDKAKIKVKKIIDLIKKWLILIPGINKFFLEQEAKIKADGIMNIKK